MDYEKYFHGVIKDSKRFLEESLNIINQRLEQMGFLNMYVTDNVWYTHRTRYCPAGEVDKDTAKRIETLLEMKNFILDKYLAMIKKDFE